MARHFGTELGVEPAFIPDRSNGRWPHSDADAKAHHIALVRPSGRKRLDLPLQVDRKPHRAMRRIPMATGALSRIITPSPANWISVASCRVITPPITSIIFLQCSDDDLRLGARGERGETAQIGKDGDNVAPVALEQSVGIFRPVQKPAGPETASSDRSVPTSASR